MKKVNYLIPAFFIFGIYFKSDIHIGMTEKEVQEMFGRPDHVSCTTPDLCSWRWKPGIIRDGLDVHFLKGKVFEVED